MLAWLTSRFAWIAALLAAALAALGLARRDGRKAEQADAKEKDWKRAQDIRDRVDALPDRGMRDDDRRGYRD